MAHRTSAFPFPRNSPKCRAKNVRTILVADAIVNFRPWTFSLGIGNGVGHLDKAYGGSGFGGPCLAQAVLSRPAASGFRSPQGGAGNNRCGATRLITASKVSREDQVDPCKRPHEENYAKVQKPTALCKSQLMRFQLRPAELMVKLLRQFA